MNLINETRSGKDPGAAERGLVIDIDKRLVSPGREWGLVISSKLVILALTHLFL